MDLPLTCNNLKCRAELGDRALVTTCSHVFCLDCAKRFTLSDQDRPAHVPCPACDTQLTNPDDAVLSHLKPSEAYKTSILSGLSPSVIMECAGRALSFWAYQTTQNIYYQQHLYKTLTEKYAALGARLEQTVGDANAQIDTLQRRIDALALENEAGRKKNEELARAYKDKNRQLLQTQELHDKLRHTVEMGHIQRAATDAIDSRFQQQPALRNLAPQQQPAYGNAHRPGSGTAFRGYGVGADQERVSDGGLRGNVMDPITGPWRRNGSATGHATNAPANLSRFGTRGLMDGERSGMVMGHAPNSAERRRYTELNGAGKSIGGLSSGIKVSQPMGTGGLQRTADGFMGIRNT